METKLNTTKSAEPYTAIVAGATGATGRWIVGNLVNDEKCNKVIALTRSDIADVQAAFPSARAECLSDKLVVHKLDWEELKSKAEFRPELLVSPTVGFCALGSAPYSEESDFTLPVAFGNACKKSGVRSMFLVSAQGAKAGSWIGYSDTIGRREDAFTGMGFDRLGIYRPGAMDRQEKRRIKEYFGYILPSCWVIDTRDIAKAMVSSVGLMKEGVHHFSHSEMKKFCAKID